MTQHLGKEIQELVNSALEAYEQLESAMHHISAETTRLGVKYSIVSTSENHQAKSEIKQSAFNALIHEAEKRFSPPGGKLDIYPNSIFVAACKKDRWGHVDKDSIDLIKVWDFLEETYGGSKGEEIAHQQTANFLVRELGIKAGATPRFVSGKLVVDTTMYLDSIDKRFGQNRYSITSANDLQKTMRSLSAMAKWADEVATGVALVNISETLNYRHQVVSRERFYCGLIELVTFHNRVEFKVSQPLADRFMEYLSTYATNLIQEAA